MLFDFIIHKDNLHNVQFLNWRNGHFVENAIPLLGEKDLCWGDYTAIGCSKISFSVDEMPIRRKFR